MKKRERKHAVQVYLSDDEYNLLWAKTRLSKSQSCSDFLRHLIVYGFVFDIDYSDLREYNYQLSRIGNNLNQIAHQANIKEEADSYDLKEAKEIMKKIWHTQKSMLSKQPRRKL